MKLCQMRSKYLFQKQTGILLAKPVNVFHRPTITLYNNNDLKGE